MKATLRTLEAQSEVRDSWLVAGTATFARILVPVDFAEGSRLALRTALALKQVTGSDVHLFHVAAMGADDQFIESMGGSSTTPAEFVQDSKDRLLSFVDHVCPGHSSDVSVHASSGVELVEGIVHMAKKVGATLVLVARRSTDSVFRTHAERVARSVDAAVLFL
jgi:nucleotide-binding universal stress UspA family protein